MLANIAAKLRAAVDEAPYATSSEIVRGALRVRFDKEERLQAERICMRTECA